MASYRSGNVLDRNCTIDNDQTYERKSRGIVELLDGPQRTARESNMDLLETYQFEARTGEPVRDLKGGACSLHVESGACSFPALPRPLNFASNCGCQCSCSPCPPPCPPTPPCCYPCPPCPRPVESCLPGLHQTYRDCYRDCKETHLARGYRDFVEHDDLYLPPSRPLSAASNYCNRATSSRSWSPPSPSPQLKCHFGVAQYQSAHLPQGRNWDMPESKPCFQTFFQASPSPRGSPPRHPSRCESLYLVETPQQRSPRHPHSESTSPVQPHSEEFKDVINISCQCSLRVDTDSRPKSFQTQKSGVSSPPSPCNPEFSTNILPYSGRKRPPPSNPANYLSKPMGYPEAYAAELVTVEKHVQYNWSPRLESAELDEPYTRRPSIKPSKYDAGASIRRVLRPSSPLDLARSSSRQECTCQQNKPAAKKSYNQMHFPTQNGTSSQSPGQSSISTPQHGTEEADLNTTTFLNEVKRILTSDVPPSLSPTVRKQDYYSNERSALKSEFPSRELNSSTGSIKDRKSMLFSSGRTTDWQEENLSSTDYFSGLRSTLQPAVPKIDFFSRANKKQDPTARDQLLVNGKTQNWEQDFPSNGRTTDWKQDWEDPSSGRRTDRRQQAEWEISSKQASEFPSHARKADRKQWEFPSNLDWEFPLTDRKQEYSTCIKTTERGSSPIIVTPTLKDSGPNTARAGIELTGRSKTAPITMNSEAPSNSRSLQCGDGLHDAAEKPSIRTPQHGNSPPPESEDDIRYGPGQAIIPKAAEPAKRTFNKQDFTSSRQPNREVMRRCCCGVCKGTYSRSHFTTKCPFCANAHSCCCGMCSCPFSSCTSKSPILESSNTSNNTSTTSSPRNYRLPFHNHHQGFSSRPKSLSPMRKTYLAGLDNSYRQRSKSTRAKCKLQQREFEPSPRALLESFHNYLKLESRRAKAGSSPHRRCFDRRSTHWKHMSPDRTCSQRARRVNTRKAPRGSQQQQAPWGTHPILLSSRPPNLEYRLPYSGTHRGCCCSICVNGKL